MTYAELMNVLHLQIGRVEMTWHRVMYLHAAIVGVLMFFGEAQSGYLFQRALVFGFYTVNLVIFYASLHEGYQGVIEVQADLRRFPADQGSVDAWFRKRRYAHKPLVRIAVLFCTWAFIGALLFQSWLFGF
ncbi:MAG: hypothetical protein ABJL67_02295 [Sulfitobacter sp.]